MLVTAGTTATVMLGGGGGDSGYNGYFKITDASITDDNGKTVNKIRIVDGATYDAGQEFQEYQFARSTIRFSISKCFLLTFRRTKLIV